MQGKENERFQDKHKINLKLNMQLIIKMNASPSQSTASSDAECDSPEAVLLREIAEPLLESLQKEVFETSLKWLDFKEDMQKKQQILINQIKNLNEENNEDYPRSVAINFEIRVSAVAKEVHPEEVKELQDEVDNIKRKTQEKFSNVAMNATDLNIRAQQDKWLTDFCNDCVIIT